MKRRTFTYSLLFFMTLQFYIGCTGDSDVKRASLPSSLGVQPSLYIGQQVKTFLSEVECVEDDSDHHYCCDIAYGNYFNYLCINEGHPGSRVIKTISLRKTYSRTDPDIATNLESNAIDIIEILIEAYGNDFEITDDLLKRPKLVWKNDSCIVKYAYVPVSIYNKEKTLTGEVLNASNVLVIVSTDTEEYSEPVQPSRQYTKESLGLN